MYNKFYLKLLEQLILENQKRFRISEKYKRGIYRLCLFIRFVYLFISLSNGPFHLSLYKLQRIPVNFDFFSARSTSS